ncbi:3-ketoacyl-CoA thiolase [Novosphingobium marinum]|uniref:Acetyl-CoA C-acetyltransferase n=1 Tax=Novosphingobium marinum TaxID=1514948 RepID=A0A7Y9XWG4_9SPHN|nr:acetyl-CoA C-acyltransferase family protein [Novosphingobium marinum]NYH94583.1 acetyl-CoA C-acetyltransferase [Novosphingobium marinum]GGC23460.1 3-ketoacyl-CoA thiolase [Novosphingobium marinum]
MNEVVILSGARLPIGSFGGSLKGFRPAELGEIAIREAISRSGLEASDVQQVVVGNVVPSQPADAYIARVAAVKAGIPIEAPAMTVNRLCGSGLQAIVSAAQFLKLGEAQVAVGAGAESMSNAPHMTSAARFGSKMGSIELTDAMLGALHDPFENIHMGITAENIADQCQITREQQDELAVESQKRAAKAVAEGYFKEQIVPVEIKSRKGTTVFDHDEHVRGDATIEAMAGLKPVFKKDGTVTAGNASGLNDGGAAVVLATAEAAEKHGKKPLARIVSWGHAGVEPSVMGLGPVKAVPIALERAGLSLDQMDTIESNEAFAAQACGVAKQLGFDPAKTNPNGSGISLGHPIGATGAILTVKAMYELKRIGGRYGLITMCIGGGQGIAMVIENVE